MADFFIDFSAVGTNDGTSRTNAWSDFASVIADQNNVAAGDTVYFCGGQTYDDHFEVPWQNGTLANPINIKIDPQEGRNGIALINQGMAIRYDNYHLVFDGDIDGNRRLQVRNRTSNGTGHGIRIYGVEDITIKNIKVYDVGVANDDHGISVSNGCTGIYFDNVEIDDVWQDGININEAPLFTDFETFIVENCIITDFGDDGVQCGSGVTIRYNYIRGNPFKLAGAHPDGVQLTNRQYNKIYGNEIWDMGNGGLFIEDTLGHLYIYNNIIGMRNDIASWADTYRALAIGRDAADANRWPIVICNNNFVNFKSYTAVQFGTYFPFNANDDLTINNNIFYNNRIHLDDPDNFWDGNNTFYNEPDGDVTFYDSSTGNPIAWTNGGAIPAGADYRDPVFKDPDNYDFSLQSTSDEIDDGIDNSSVMLSVDIDETERPQGDGWDRGAHEFSIAVEPDPDPEDTVIIKKRRLCLGLAL